MNIQIALAIFINNIFNTVLCSITSLPHSMFCICPAIVISSHMDEKQSMYRLKRLKERHFLCAVNVSGRKA